MAITAIKCPGYYETGNGKVARMYKGEERFFEPAIIQEVGNQIRVLCVNCINGIFVSGVGKIDPEGLNGIGDGSAKQTKCVFRTDILDTVSN